MAVARGLTLEVSFEGAIADIGFTCPQAVDVNGEQLYLPIQHKNCAVPNRTGNAQLTKKDGDLWSDHYPGILVLMTAVYNRTFALVESAAMQDCPSELRVFSLASPTPPPLPKKFTGFFFRFLLPRRRQLHRRLREGGQRARPR